jgi:hypothetical protein
VDKITWKPKTWPKWPGNLRLRRDPGDIASVDCGIRSRRTSLITSTNWARFTCAHARVTVHVDMGERRILTPKSLSLLVLWLTYHGNTCPCFRARWRRLDPDGKFCRAAAIKMWRWIERTIGHENVHPTWEERVGAPADDEEWRDWGGECVDDGFMQSSKYAAPRLPRHKR